jgi:multiple sugar transport system substrate-binding protein
MAKEKLSRRDFLLMSGTAAAGTLLAACQPQVVERTVEVEKIVEQTVEVEKVVEVEQTVEVEKVVEVPAGVENVVLTHTFWGTSAEWQLWVAFDDQFSAEHPGISVISEHIPTQYESQIMMRRAADDMPNVLNMQDEPFPRYADQDVYTNLDPFVEMDAAELDLDDFFPQLLDMFKWDKNTKTWMAGSQYAMPWDGAGILWYYNMDLFDELGLEPPANNGWDWTMDEFLDLCLQIAEFDSDGNMTRGAFGLPTWVYHMPFIMTMGGMYVDQAATKCLMDTPESIAAVQYYMDLRLKHHVCPYTSEFAGMSALDLFREGTVPMNLTGPWWFPDLRAIPWEELRWDCLHFPKNPTTGERYVRQSWDGMAIGVDTENQDASWEYIKFILSHEGQARIAELGRAMPARPSVANSEDFMNPDLPPPNEKVFYDAVEYYHVQPINLYWDEMWTVIGKYWDEMSNEDIRLPVEEGCAKIAAGVNYLFENGELPADY